MQVGHRWTCPGAKSHRTPVVAGRKGEWLTTDEYQKVVTKIEEQFSVAFDMKHPQITKGRAMNIYMERR